MEIITVNQERSFISKDLNNITHQITKIAGDIKKNYYNIAALLVRVDKEKLYEADGFTSAVDYAMQTFKLKKSAVYTMLTIGREYTNTAKLESNLPHENGKDFTATQIEKMLPLKGRENVVAVIESGQINSDMTCKEIGEVVKGIITPPTEEEEEGEKEKTPKTAKKDSGDKFSQVLALMKALGISREEMIEYLSKGGENNG